MRVTEGLFSEKTKISWANSLKGSNISRELILLKEESVFGRNFCGSAGKSFAVDSYDHFLTFVYNVFYK